MAVELVGMHPGKEIELSREHVVTAFPTRHTVPSLGYVVWERRKKLKPEYQGRGGDQIRDIRLCGERGHPGSADAARVLRGRHRAGRAGRVSAALRGDKSSSPR